jgi:tetratricopeptide (TPR) repeat protein
MFRPRQLIALESAPATTRALAERCYATAYAALLADDDKTAVEMFCALAVLAPRDARAWAGLAVCSQRHGLEQAALALFQLGASFDPEQAALCHLGRGRALSRLGRDTAADDAFDDACQATDDLALRASIDRERKLQ